VQVSFASRAVLDLGGKTLPVSFLNVLLSQRKGRFFVKAFAKVMVVLAGHLKGVAPKCVAVGHEERFSRLMAYTAFMLN
jgi:hypothetical protein